MERDDRTIFMESLQLWDNEQGEDKVRLLLSGQEIDELVDELFARSFDLDEPATPLAACG